MAQESALEALERKAGEKEAEIGGALEQESRSRTTNGVGSIRVLGEESALDRALDATRGVERGLGEEKVSGAGQEKKQEVVKEIGRSHVLVLGL